MVEPTLLLGAVAHDAKTVPIWEGLREHFRDQGLNVDFVLYSNYERQVDALLRGHVDIAWNSPLAHARVQRSSDGRTISIGMRDTDRDVRARVIVRRDAGLKSLDDLAGKTLAVGSADSTQARILPLYFLRQVGAPLAAVRVLPFDTDLGKHGYTGSGELDVLRALSDGRAEAGTVGDLVWLAEQAAGRVDPEALESLWTSPPFDLWMFDARPELSLDLVQRFQKALFALHWDEPRHQALLEMLGLRQWLPPREEGHASLRAALDELDPRP